MKCVRTETDAGLRLQIEGALDALTARDVRPLFDQIVTEKPKHVTIDLEALTLIDSSGIGAIVSLFKRVKADGGKVTIEHAREQPLAVLKLLKLDKIFGL